MTAASTSSDFASGWTGPGAAVTSEDAAAPGLSGRTTPAVAVPRGDDAPSGHGRAHPALSAGAVLSNDGRYRYALGRSWGTGPSMAFVMLNPSTADDRNDDPTVRRCLAFARAAGCGGVLIGNLYAWRSSDPAALRTAADPVGPDNDAWLTWLAAQPGPVVVAWGARPDARRVAAALALLEHRPLSCLGLTAHGQPRHPLYVRSRTPLRPFAARGQEARTW